MTQRNGHVRSVSTAINNEASTIRNEETKAIPAPGPMYALAGAGQIRTSATSDRKMNLDRVFKIDHRNSSLFWSVDANCSFCPSPYRSTILLRLPGRTLYQTV